MDFRDFIKHMIQNGQAIEFHGPGCPGHSMRPNFAEWIQVGTLKPEDITRHRTIQADLAKLQGEAKVMESKIRALEAQAKAISEEWWNHIHVGYNIPRQGDFHLDDDGAIRKRPGCNP